MDIKVNGVLEPRIKGVRILSAHQSHTTNLRYEGYITADSPYLMDLMNKDGFTLEYAGNVYRGCAVRDTRTGNFIYFRVNE